MTSKIQSESMNLADTYNFTGDVTGAGGTNTPHFEAYRSGSQAISNGVWTTILFNAEARDASSLYDTSNTV